MNTTYMRFATHARTWLLIAGLTALLVGIGALIGGAFLYLFAGLAVAFNVIGYWFSDRLALRFSHARPVEPGTMPELEAMIHDLAQRAQVPAPRLYTIPSEQPNAFATGRNPQHAAVAVTEGLLQNLPAVQVKGVLAHEFAHIKNRDILVSSIAATVAGAIAAIAEVFQWSLFFGGSDEEDERSARLDRAARDDHRRRRSRPRCSSSPSRASASTSPTRPERNCSVTRRRSRTRSRSLENAAKANPISINPATASLYIVNPLTRQGFATLFATHPPLAERARRLRALGHEQALDKDRAVQLAAA